MNGLSSTKTIWAYSVLMLFVFVCPSLLGGCSGTSEKRYDLPVYDSGDLDALYQSLGNECIGPQDCAGAFCSEGTCCTEACTGPCQTCEMPGYEGQCLPTKCSFPQPDEWEFQEEDSSDLKLEINAPSDSQQLRCFDDSEEKPCTGQAEVRDCGQTPFCGQDAQYATRDLWVQPDRFATLNTGWILDQTTQLYWKDTEQELSWAEAKEACAEIKEGAWNLPSRAELLSLVVFGSSNPASPFPGINPAPYWADEQDVSKSDNAWSLDFSNGTSNTIEKSTLSRALCVRFRSAE